MGEFGAILGMWILNYSTQFFARLTVCKVRVRVRVRVRPYNNLRSTFPGLPNSVTCTTGFRNLSRLRVVVVVVSVIVVS